MLVVVAAKTGQAKASTEIIVRTRCDLNLKNYLVVCRRPRLQLLGHSMPCQQAILKLFERSPLRPLSEQVTDALVTLWLLAVLPDVFTRCTRNAIGARHLSHTHVPRLHTDADR